MSTPPITPDHVLKALALACREYGVPYGRPGDDRWLAATPTGPTTAVVAVVTLTDDKPTIHAAFKVTLEPAEPPRPEPPADVPRRECPATADYPHPGHLWHRTGTAAWETVTGPADDAHWCGGQIETNLDPAQPVTLCVQVDIDELAQP